LLNGHNGVTAEMAIRLEKAGWDPPNRGCTTRCPMISGKPRRGRPRSRSRSSHRGNQCEHLRRDGLAGAFGCITTLRWRRARRGGGGRRTRAAFFGDRF
jgi:hypothetical protein